EREPRTEETRSDDGIAEDAAARRLDEHAGVAEAGDPHGALPFSAGSSLPAVDSHDSSNPRMSSALSDCENRASSSTTAWNRRALRCCRAMTFSSIVSAAIRRYTSTRAV